MLASNYASWQLMVKPPHYSILVIKTPSIELISKLGGLEAKLILTSAKIGSKAGLDTGRVGSRAAHGETADEQR